MISVQSLPELDELDELDELELVDEREALELLEEALVDDDEVELFELLDVLDDALVEDVVAVALAELVSVMVAPPPPRTPSLAPQAAATAKVRGPRTYKLCLESVAGIMSD